MTLPILTQNTRNAQVGPKLAKAVSMFEQANQALLEDQGVNSLISLYAAGAEANYVNNLMNFMHIGPTDVVMGQDAAGNNSAGINNRDCFTAGGFQQPNLMPARFISKDGILYAIRISVRNAARPPHRVQYGTVYVDIDGVNSGLNRVGRDIFGFTWWADGSLRPVGGAVWAENVSVAAKDDDDNDINFNSNNCTWQNLCPAGAVFTEGLACTGHIFENNLRVLYN